MVPLPLLRRRDVSVSLAIGFAVNVAFYGTIFLLGLYYQQLRGMSGTEAGLMFVPLAAIITSTNLVSPPMAERFGRRPVIVTGQAVLALGMFCLLPLAAHTPVWLILLSCSSRRAWAARSRSPRSPPCSWTACRRPARARPPAS